MVHRYPSVRVLLTPVIPWEFSYLIFFKQYFHFLEKKKIIYFETVAEREGETERDSPPTGLL